MHRILTVIILSAVTFATTAQAERVLYFGLGDEEKISTTTVERPWTLGGFADTKNNFIFGFDLAEEGAALETTHGQSSIEQAMSINLIFGRQMTKTETSRFDIGPL